MMDPLKLNGIDAINHLKTLPLNDITDLKDTTRWEFFFTKMNPDKKYTLTWVEERLLFYEKGFLTYALRAYRVGISFDHQDGKIDMMMGGGFHEQDRDALKEKLDWEEGNILIFISTDEKMGKFQLIPTSALNIIQQNPFTKEKETEIITPFIEGTRSQINELRLKFDNGDFSVKSELEKQQNEFVSLIGWTKEKEAS